MARCGRVEPIVLPENQDEAEWLTDAIAPPHEHLAELRVDPDGHIPRT